MPIKCQNRLIKRGLKAAQNGNADIIWAVSVVVNWKKKFLLYSHWLYLCTLILDSKSKEKTIALIVAWHQKNCEKQHVGVLVPNCVEIYVKCIL